MILHGAVVTYIMIVIWVEYELYVFGGSSPGLTWISGCKWVCCCCYWLIQDPCNLPVETMLVCDSIVVKSYFFICAVVNSASQWNCVNARDENLSSSTSTSALDCPVRVCVFIYISWFLYWCSHSSVGPCGLWGCNSWPAPFPGQMSYKATKLGLALSVVYLTIFYCIVVY